MDILVCFKTVPDIDSLPEAVWENTGDLNPDLSCAPPAWSCYEESALALALDYASKYGASLHALTVGGSEAFLKTLLALGFKSGASVACDEDLRFRPELVSALIAGYIKRLGGCSLVLLGSRSADGSSGLVGAYLAVHLDAVLVSFAAGFEPAADNLLRVHALTDRFKTTVVTKTPCILTIGNSPVSFLPVPTLKDRVRAGGMDIERLNPADIGVDVTNSRLAPAVRLTGLQQKANKREAKLISGTSPHDTAARLYAALKGRLDIG